MREIAEVRVTKKSFNDDYHDIIPEELSRKISARSLKKGYALFKSGALSGLNFFRSVHKAVCQDGDRRYFSFYFESASISGFSSHSGYCTCSTENQVMCAHVTALLFALYFKSGEKRLYTHQYEKSFFYKTAIAVCKLSENTLPFQVKVNPGLIEYFDSKGICQIRVTQPVKDFLPDFVGLPQYQIRCSSKHFYNFCNNAVTKEDKKQMQFIPRAPSLQEALGPIGDLFRQYFLFAHNPEGVLEYLPDNRLFMLRMKPAGGMSIELYLLPEQAWILYRNFPDILELGSRSKIQDPPLAKKFKLQLLPAGDLEIAPRIIDEEGKELLHWETEHPGFGEARYIPGKGFYRIKTVDALLSRRFLSWKKYNISNKNLVEFFKKYKDDLENRELCLDNTEILNQSRKASISGLRLEVSEKNGTKYLFSVIYQIEDYRMGIDRILAEKEQGRDCLITPHGWIKFTSKEFFWMNSLKKSDIEKNNTGLRVWLSKVKALRVCSFVKPENIVFDWGKYPALKALKPQDIDIASLASEPNVEHLRKYQKEGFQWLAYLYHNQISGILADEMGLGKTHQVMALIAKVMRESPSMNVLVVCPTSVLYHWQDKLGQFYPEVGVKLYHSVNRTMQTNDDESAVIITSYGIIRNDRAIFGEIDFDLIILDEVQMSKNRSTETYKALSTLRGRTWIGMSGTPVENCSWELKNIFDLLLPDYFPDKGEFAREIAIPLERLDCPAAAEYLVQLIRPFVLRRTKAQVLKDLPEKVEETYRCELNPQQKIIYDACYAEPSAACLEDLKDTGKPVAYLHIFALINRLKQVCNHPGSLEEYFSHHERYESGKWDICRELMENALENGLKVVIFSQYLKMLAIMESYLTRLGIDFGKLTGGTSKRHLVIRRFQEDPQCKVFLCSLKAGGIGIDLTAASVVIHYDRWWNAARENQATDRVHRIGQHRNVQIYKLVTLKTLEEKIDKIISRKAHLTGSILKEDLNVSLKMLSREELMEILSLS